MKSIDVRADEEKDEDEERSKRYRYRRLSGARSGFFACISLFIICFVNYIYYFILAHTSRSR